MKRAPVQNAPAGSADIELAPSEHFPVRWNSRPLVLLFIAFGIYYLWSARPHFTDEDLEPGVYNAIADAFIHGRTSLLAQPKPELLALPDPYDPEQNGLYRLHDLSLYKGKYYAYFGPAAAALVFVPYQLLFDDGLPDSVAAPLFALGAFIGACQLLRLLVARWYPHTSPRVYYFLCVTLGFCSVYPFLVRRPAVYEVAISSSQLFLLAGLAIVVKAAFDRNSLRWSVAAGVALGIAVLSRASLIVAGLALVLIYALDRDDSVEHRRRKLITAALPLIAGIALFGLYNWVRFDSPFEFGTRYQLASMHPAKTKLFSTARYPLHSYLFLIYPPKLTSTFPFLVANKPDWSSGATYLLFDRITGLLWVSPLLLILPGFFWLYYREAAERARELKWTVSTFAIVGILLLLIDMMLLATMRYQADFASLLSVTASVVVVGIAARLPAGRPKTMFQVAVGVLAGFGILLNAAIGLMGYYRGLNVTAPAEFHALEIVFSPVAAVLRALGVAP